MDVIQTNASRHNEVPKAIALRYYVRDMLQSVTQASILKNIGLLLFKSLRHRVEIRHNPFSPGLLCTTKCLKLFDCSCKKSIFIDLVSVIFSIL